MYQAPRGTADILPEEQAFWRYVEQKATEIAHLYGYQRIDLPTFEDTRIFARTAGELTDVVQKEMYTFQDRGGDSLTLRPEGTAPVCRAYIEHGMHNLPQPVKLYYMASIFRYDRPQAGRYREHCQFGVEAIGDEDPVLDAEVIDLAWQFYRSLGITGLRLKLNSIGCKNCRPAYLEKLKHFYAGFEQELCQDCKVRLDKNPLRLLDCKNSSCQQIAESAPKNYEFLCLECETHFKQLKKYLDLLQLPFEIDHRLVRGLDYYSRTVFEIQPELEGGQSTIAGGGRYDGLIELLGGRPTPGIGFGTGFERIILNLKRQNISIPSFPNTRVFIATLGDTARESAVKLSNDLRRGGVSLVMASGGRSLKAQLRQANSLGVLYTIIIGEDEIKAGTVQLREMSSSSQQTIQLDRLASFLKI